ncbi:hypothetical protein XENTR_v10000369 [Xenopus tropicalis]|uniref:Cell growth-regulating nucleolar protein n=1 Tax=Xenopus tropicalis TaxID=8364 RepID=F6S272_XENTR|nr:cell growth-regulating nucleolar protein [Xenopus tropicalis]KAE8629142.1 hypothetical protein XENTR_v10000369 [Xenopus tropicalis]
MVFFTCNACGESLKKGQVEKHRGKCRNCGCLSCIDCGKDFWGDDYQNHLKCISEDQKYGGKAFEAKANKGDVKQQQWLERIQEIMKKPNISPNIRNILNQMSSYENIPRKKAKFQNWMKNSLKIYNQTLHDQVWEIFAEATRSAPVNNQEKHQKSENSVAEDKSEQTPEAVEEHGKKKSKRELKEERKKKNKKEKKDLVDEQVETVGKKKTKKRKMEEDEMLAETAVSVERKKKKKKHHDEDENDSEGQAETSVITEEEEGQCGLEEENGEDESADVYGESNRTARGKFNWRGTIKALLKEAPDNELPIKRLRKKVLAQYHTVSSEYHKSEKDLLVAFNKKIHNNPKFRVLKERVKLLK